jgi:hypothetical protein
MTIGHRPFGQMMTTTVETPEGVVLGKVRRKVRLLTTGANNLKVSGYTYHATVKIGPPLPVSAKHSADQMADILAWFAKLFPQYK